MSRIRLRLLVVSLFCALTASPMQAATRLIVRTPLLGILQSACFLLGCNVQYGLGDPQGQLFLVTAPLNLNINLFLNLLGVVSVEVDSTGTISAATQTGAPPALLDSTPVNYYGTLVREGYVLQPATQLVGLANAQKAYGLTGTGTVVAVIDTGVDTTHPVLANALVAGYDFTRNKTSADEKGDVSQSTTAVVDQSTTAVVDQSTTAVVDGYTASQLNQPQYQDFGHGTMVAGVVHLVAPYAKIMPLKAFHADGTGYLSDVIRAIYFATRNHAKVLNMSFNFTSSSPELNTALKYANVNGAISVAATGNNGLNTTVYPAGYSGTVMGVASTSNVDVRSTFSNYGQPMTWLAAPGEGVVTLYPFGTYAATWGTSFSTPFVAGTASLLLDVQPLCTQIQAAQALSHAKYIDSTLGNGRIDIYQAVHAYRQNLGLR